MEETVVAASPDHDAADGAPLRLTDVLASLDSQFLRQIAGPSYEPSPRINDLVIYDVTDPQTIGIGALVLGVGIGVDSADAASFLKRVAGEGAAGVVVRTDRPVSDGFADLALRLGMSVLGVPADMRWDQVYSLLRTAMVNTGEFQLSLDGGVPIGDLFALADAIAVAVGGPVTIEDPHWRVLAYSNLDYEIDQPRRETILGRTPPAIWHDRIRKSGVIDDLLGGQDVVRFEGPPGEGLAPRLVAPIRAGDELLGALWVAEAETPFDAEAERELARAGKLAAIHLLSYRASEDIKRRTRGAFVREVLEGWAPSRSTIGMLRATGPFTVIVFEPEHKDEGVGGGNLERVLGIASLHCESQYPEAVCALIDDRIWGVLPALDARDLAIAGLAERILDRVERSLGIRLVAAIGTSVPSIADVPHSRRAAEQALAVLRQRTDGTRVVHIEDVRAHAVLLELIDWASANEELTHGKLHKLRQCDAERGTAYVPTLRAYLDVSGDIAVAAKRLSVHPNTLRHRMRRLLEVSGLDLDDPDERLVTELQLRMRH